MKTIWPEILGYHRRMASYIVRFLLPGSTLDIGCADGEITGLLQKKYGWVIDGIDMYSDRYPTYDGITLPFKSKTYTQSYFCFVLHHARDPQKLLKEAIRVTRCRIIIAEDVAETPWQRFVASWHDWLANKISNTLPDVEYPNNYLSTKQWIRLFHKCGLELIAAMPIKSTIFSVNPQILFVLDAT